MKPVVLLIPGMLNTSDIWHGVAPLLQARADVRVADVATQDSIAAMAADAWQLVAGLADATPLLVCGYSMGGYVAAELLAEHAGRVSAAAFIDSSAMVDSPDTRRGMQSTIEGMQTGFTESVENMIRFSLHRDNRNNEVLVSSMRQMLHAVGAGTAIRQARAILARADRRAALAQLRMPVLVACGTADRVTPPDLSRDLAALIPGARLLWIERAGHQTPLEQPGIVAEALLSLLPA